MVKVAKKILVHITPNPLNKEDPTRVDGFVWHDDGTNEKLTKLSKAQAIRLLDSIPDEAWS